MRVLVISPQASKFDGEATSVVAPVYDGEVGILPNHAPFMAPLGKGVLSIQSDGSTARFRIEGGFLQVVSNTVRVVAERVEGVDDAS
jgi:F-type H+-transporting ATPase subunit epsilon